LNSIHDGYKAAMSSKSGRETLLSQLTGIVNSVMQYLDKVKKTNMNQNTHE